jgi:AcrR family transcriptional regulator
MYILFMTRRLAASRVRAPQQARSRASLERILNAAETLIESRPLESVTVSDIVRRARVSIGNFYKRFATKEAVLDALYARYESQRTEHLSRALSPERSDGTDLEARARRLATILVEMFRKRRGVMRAFVMHHRGGNGSTDGAMHRRLDALYRSGAELLLGAAKEIRHPHPEEAARFGALMTASLCRELILFKQPNDPGAVAMNDERLVDELTRTLVGYLRCHVSPQREARETRKGKRAR